MVFPKISIITPTFNASVTLERALLSVANQSYNNIEHIFMDNLSTDGTAEIIQKYQEKFPHIRLISQKDKGIYDAMNKGIDLVTGDWIYFLGADDELSGPGILTEIFNEGHFSKNKVIYGNVLVKGDTTWASDNTIYDGPFDLKKLLTTNICHQAIFYPASLVKKAGYFNEKYFVTADWEYNIHCYALIEFEFIDKIIAIFQTGGISSTGVDDKMLDDLPFLLLQYFNLDITDEEIYKETSPFYPVMRRIQKTGEYTTGNFGMIHRVKQLLKKIFTQIFH